MILEEQAWETSNNNLVFEPQRLERTEHRHTYLIKTIASKSTSTVDQQCSHVLIFERTIWTS